MQEVGKEALSQVQWGHGLLALCAVLYLVWWIVFFRPDAGKVQGALYWFGAACLVLAVCAGVAGAIFAALGANGLRAGSGLSGWWFILTAAVVYLLFAWMTMRFWERPITTELLLFVAWAALELYVVSALGTADLVGLASLICLITAIIILFALSLVCYVLYYRLSALPSFIDGAMPLFAVCLFSAVLLFVVRAL